MGARELGQLCEAARQERGWSLARVAYEIGLVPPEDRALNESQVKRILEGRRGLDVWMVSRLIQIFDLDEATAWAASGLLPPGVTADMLRGLFASRTPAGAGVPAIRVLREYVVPPGQGGVLLPLPANVEEFGELVRRNRRRGDRRRRPVPELLVAA